MSAQFPEQGPFEEPPATSFRWSGWDLVIFGVYFGLVYLILVAVASSFVSDGELVLSPILTLLIQSALDLLLLGFIVVLVKVVHGQSFFKTIHWTRAPQYSYGYLIAAGAFLAVTVMIVSSFLPSGETTPIEELLKSADNVFLFAFYGIAIAPLVEEVIFRGFVFKVLSDISNVSAAVTLTTVLFTALHIPQLWGNWPAVALIFVVGYILGLMRGRSGSLIPPFVMHAAYNGLLFAVFAIGQIAKPN